MVDADERERLNRHRLLDADGHLVRWPTKRPQRELALRYLSGCFAPNQIYAEVDVNEILKRWHTFDDWALLRRELVDRGYLSRDAAGREYRVASLPETQDNPSV